MTVLDEAVTATGEDDARVTTRMVVPGAGTLELVRDRASSALLAIRGEGRSYLEVVDGEWRWDGVCTTRERRLEDGMEREVMTAYGSWRERYRWDGDALVEVDGVAIRRDAEGRVIACVPGGADPVPASHVWRYSHGDRGIVHLSTPSEERTVALDERGRPRSMSAGGEVATVAHDRDGRRIAPGRPLADHVDDAGRCWARVGADGRVAHVYLWDGSRCLARIDGAVGAPLGAVFSLDPSATPVRVVGPDACVRVPRDAFGEGLLGIGGAPGLFGGQVHGGIVHLPLRRLDPRTGAWCEPDPYDGSDADPRRGPVGTARRSRDYEGPLAAEPAPRSAYEVCRGDPVGRADPSGGVSAGLIISDLTWSFQNNILSFFGVDWWFNLFASLICAPAVWAGKLDYDFFSSTGLVASDRHGGFGVRRGGIINAITGGRAFTTQHIVWAPDSEFAELEHGEVIDPGGALELTQYGAVLLMTPSGKPATLLQSMALAERDWAAGAATTLPGWTRHGGVGVPAAPGTLSPVFPTGGLHLDTPRTDTRGDVPCTLQELVPGAVALGDLEPRAHLRATSATGLAAGDGVLLSDGTVLALASVAAVVPLGGGESLQLDAAPTLAAGPLTAVAASEVAGSAATHPAGAVTDSLDVHGTAATYGVGDLLRIVTGSTVTVARVARLEARLPLDRALPAGLAGPITVARASVGAASVPVTVAGGALDFGTAALPAIGSTGLVSGGGVDVAVRIETHAGTTVTVDAPLAAVGTSPVFRALTAGAVLGTRADAAEAAAQITYAPTVAGAAPGPAGGLLALRLDAGGQSHARLVTGAPVHDVVVADRTLPAGARDVTRFTTSGATATGLTRSDLTALLVPDPARFASAPAVFLTKVDGSDPATTGSTPTAATPVLASADIASGVLATTTSALLPAATLPHLGPGQPLLVGDRPAVVRTTRVTLEVDRALDLAPSGLRLVELGVTGHAYRAQRLANDVLVATGVAALSTGDVPVPFPRFAPGDLVRVRGGGTSTWHRVDRVDGGRLRLVDGPVAAPGPDVTVEHAIVVEATSATATPEPTGGALLGRDGTRTGSGPTREVSFAVWSVRHAMGAGAVGIVDGDVTHPVTVVAGDRPVELTFSEDLSATGAAVALMNRLDDAFVTALTRDGAALLLDGPAGGLETRAGESLIAVAYVPGGASATATLGPGSLLVPEGEETEVSRAQSLTDHELTHTLQYSWFGPLWFNLFPMLALELPGILATDTELPEYSRFLDATVAAGTGGRWDVTVPDRHGVALATGDTLQVVQGSRIARLEITGVTGNVYAARPSDGGAAPPTGIVRVRKLQRSAAFDVTFAVFETLTHGGLVNLLAGSTWGGIFWLLGKLFYGLGRAIGGTGDTYPATVRAGGDAVTLTSSADAAHFAAEGRVIVRHGDTTVVRAMVRTNDVLTLTPTVTLTGDVQVAMYDSHDAGSAFDWRSYAPATIDADNHLRLTLDAGHGLSPEDRITVRYRDRDFNTDVLAVDGNAIEVLDPVPVADGELSARVARIGASDPLGNADSAAMVEMGMGWMKWLFDPYGQIEATRGSDQDWSRWLLRVMRWLLGTQNFSLLPFGYLWWFRLFKGADEHTAYIEQHASQESGDLYSPLGRLFGEREPDGWARHRMVVGDIARYRFWTMDRSRFFDAGGVLHGCMVQPGRLERPTAPGARYRAATASIRTMPNRDLAGGGTVAPNGAVEVDSTPDPGTFVHAPFTVRDANPNGIPSADPLGFTPSLLGNVPVSARVERVESAYMAFTRPGTHRATVVNGIDGYPAEPTLRAENAAELHEIGQQDIFHGGQTLFYDVTVADVAVEVAGAPVAPGDTVAIVPGQRATVDVAPNTARAYAVAVPDPTAGTVSVDGRALVGGATTGAGIEVEVSRVHAASGGAYASGGLAFAGMHLSRTVHVPVRRFAVDVVDTLPLRDAVRPDGAALATLARGADGFLLVPAPVESPPAVTSIAGSPPAAGDPDPVSRADAPDAARFLGASGSAFRISFPASAATGPVVLTVRVRVDAATTADLTCTFDLT